MCRWLCGCAVVSAHGALPQQPAHAILRPAQSGLRWREEGELAVLKTMPATQQEGELAAVSIYKATMPAT
jgi:hypothetical protein